jgi:hypothetical protein
MIREELRGALARGYCHDKNRHKVLDGDLIEAMREEVEAALSQGGEGSALLVLIAQFSDLAVEMEKHSNDHIHDALPDNVGAAVEGVCADRINAILKPYRAATPAPVPAERPRDERCQDYVEYASYVGNSVMRNVMPMTFNSWITGRNG